MSRFLKKALVWLGATLLVIMLLFAFRVSILRAIGNHLIDEDELQQADAIFVLGGGSYDRGLEAAALFRKGYSGKLVCTGGNVPSVFYALDQSYSEAEISAMIAEKGGVPDSAIVRVSKSTSTKEEAEEIIRYCMANKIGTAIVLTHKFHTHRAKKVFKPLFEENGIALIMHGASHSGFSEEEWWKSEPGMIMCNNEYMKLLYYMVRY